MNSKQKHFLLEYQYKIYKQLTDISLHTFMVQDIYQKQCELLKDELNKLPELIEAILKERDE